MTKLKTPKNVSVTKTILELYAKHMNIFSNIQNRQPIYFLYLHRLLNEFADSLIKVFIPVVIYEKTSSIPAVISFILAYYILQSLLNLALRKILVRRPLPVIIFRLIPVILLQLLLLNDFSRFDTYLYIASLATATAFSNSLYWLPLNSLFTMLADEKTGSKAGQFSSASRIGNMLAPVLSGFLIASFGISSSVILAITCYLLSIAVLFPLSTHIKSFTAQLPASQPLDRPLFQPTIVLFLLLYFMVGIFDTAEMFWSLYIYSISAKYAVVGLAAGLVKFGLILANLLTGFLTDAGKWYIPAVISLFFYCMLWLLRAYIIDIYLICFVSIAAGFAKPFFLVPAFSRFINFIRRSGHIDNLLMARELSIKAGGTSAILLGLLIPVSIFKAPFIISGIASISVIYLLKKIAFSPDTTSDATASQAEH